MNAMGAKINEINSLDEWEIMMKESAASDPIVVLDVYIDWAGPCSVMQYFFDRLVIAPYARGFFLSISINHLRY